MKTALQVDITFDQILQLVKQLPKKERLKLSKELEKDEVNSRLSALMQKFRTDDLSMDVITEETEAVRQELYEKKNR